jgi:hypothetical protein
MSQLFITPAVEAPLYSSLPNIAPGARQPTKFSAHFNHSGGFWWRNLFILRS